MTLEEAIQRVEGEAFSAEVNVASDLKTFYRILSEDGAVRYLSGFKSSDLASRIHDRILGLLSEEAPEDHEHPHDSAIAAYLWIRNARHAEVAEAASHVPQTPNFWWARKLAHEFLTSEASERLAGQKA